jgi:hypothetical protein
LPFSKPGGKFAGLAFIPFTTPDRGSAARPHGHCWLGGARRTAPAW